MRRCRGWMLLLAVAMVVAEIHAASSGAARLIEAVEGYTDLALVEARVEPTDPRPGDRFELDLELVALAPRPEPIHLGVMLLGETVLRPHLVGGDALRLERADRQAGERFHWRTIWEIP